MIDYDCCMGKTLLACVLFSAIDSTPGSAFFQYIVTCKECIIPDVMIHTNNNVESVCNHGLYKKLLLLVQYVTWVQVRKLILYLTYTTATRPFYKKNYNFCQKIQAIFLTPS